MTAFAPSVFYWILISTFVTSGCQFRDLLETSDNWQKALRYSFYSWVPVMFLGFTVNGRISVESQAAWLPGLTLLFNCDGSFSVRSVLKVFICKEWPRWMSLLWFSSWVCRLVRALSELYEVLCAFSHLTPSHPKFLELWLVEVLLLTWDAMASSIPFCIEFPSPLSFDFYPSLKNPFLCCLIPTKYPLSH